MRILITTFGSLGDVHPYLAIAEELTKENASVTFATSTQHRALIESRGYAFRPIRPDIDANPAFFRKVMHERTGGRFLLRDVLFPAIRESYKDLLAALPGHDILVTHVATFAGPLVARATGIPWVSTVLAPISFFSRKDPPVMATALIPLRKHFPGITRIVNSFARREAQSWTKVVDDFQSELNQQLAGNALVEGQHSPYAVLALFSQHFAPRQPDWPPQTTLTGFPLRPSASLPPAVERFLSSGSPPVVFTLGSSAVNAPGKFFEAARGLGTRAILLAGPEAAKIPTTPDLLAVDYAPHSAVFPHASAIVHQGGIGTTSEALRSGRPSLVIPFAHDQPDNAARCERLGVARILRRSVITEHNVKHALDELLSNSSYTQAAERLAGQIRQEDGAVQAAAAIRAAR